MICPFCDSNDADVVELTSRYPDVGWEISSFTVKCHKCGARGPTIHPQLRPGPGLTGFDIPAAQQQARLTWLAVAELKTKIAALAAEATVKVATSSSLRPRPDAKMRTKAEMATRIADLRNQVRYRDARIAELETKLEAILAAVERHNCGPQPREMHVDLVRNRSKEIMMDYDEEIEVPCRGCVKLSEMVRNLKIETAKRIAKLEAALKDERTAAVAYIRDRAEQYPPDDGIFAALGEVSTLLKNGEHVEACNHGELDDLLSSDEKHIAELEADRDVGWRQECEGSTDEEDQRCRIEMTRRIKSMHVPPAEERIVALEATIEQLKELLDDDAFRKMREDRDQLLVKVEQLQDALWFYADPGTYFAIAFIGDPPCGDFVDDFDETELGLKPGKRARAALDEVHVCTCGAPRMDCCTCPDGRDNAETEFDPEWVRARWKDAEDALLDIAGGVICEARASQDEGCVCESAEQHLASRVLYRAGHRGTYGS